MKNEAKQGHGDGLCGIYSLVNTVCKFHDCEDHGRLYFQQIMLCANRLGYIDYHHIINGFEAFELKESFELFCNSFGYSFCCELIFDNEKMKERTNLLNNNQVIISYIEEDDHWIAKSKSRFFDSWPEKSSPKKEMFQKASYGIIISFQKSS